MKRGAAVLLGLALVLSGGGEAGAHALPDHAVPAAGSTVTAPPTEVRIRFNRKLDPAYGTVRVVDTSGRQVDKADGSVDAADRKLLKVSLSPLEPGVYKVIWRARTIDGHMTEGDFTFRVAP